MSTPEQPDHPPLTRKQMRDIRNTGATPVVTPAVAAEAPPPPAPTPLPRAAEPVMVAAPPVADSAVDLGVSPLTRRQARQQERIRTASVPVITPEIAAAHAASINSAVPTGASAAPQTATAALRDLFGPPATAVAPAPSAPPADAPRGEAPSVAESAPQAAPARAPRTEDTAAEASDSLWAPLTFDRPEEAREIVDAEPDEVGAEAPARDTGVLDPLFGAGLISGASATPPVETPSSFDQLLSRSSTGSVGAPNALILDTAGDAPIVGPVAATGEVLITGTFNLPEGLGSTGVAPGSADGKEVDATLVDGELPPHSSPTPIAASSAISTVKSNGDVIKPPVPEKGSRLMLTLAITAGARALALGGVLILAFVTGVF